MPTIAQATQLETWIEALTWRGKSDIRYESVPEAAAALRFPTPRARAGNQALQPR